MKHLTIKIIWILFSQLNYYTNGANNTIVRDIWLDHNENFHLKWKVDFEKEIIIFTLKVKTIGYVGFGISPSPGMTGADIVIGGVSSGAEPYFDDYFALQNGAPTKDVSKDWTLISAKETNGFTKLKYSRQFATCDDQDVDITEGTHYIIWAFGKSDKIAYHGTTNRGAVTINLLNPDEDKVDLSQYQVWKITNQFNMPSQHTSIWCTLHKAPSKLNGTTSHIVAYDIILNNEVDRKYVHHAILRRCTPPSGVPSEEFFEEFVNQGEDCSSMSTAIPIANCPTYLYIWGVGGSASVFPENVGYAMGETGSSEYVMLHMHYTNPDKVSNITTNAGVSLYYTTKRRQMNAAVMSFSSIPSHYLTIPPKSKDFVVARHCGTTCTKKALPKEGVHIFSTLLHAHLAGRKIVIRHFRGGNELPWIARDKNYDYNYQIIRPLRTHAKFMPGDHLVLECTYNTEDRDVVTLGGVSTSNEMCAAFLWIYPYTDFFQCTSYIDPMEPILKIFGIEKIYWNVLSNEDPRVLLPHSLLNKTYSSVLNSSKWTDRLRKKFQKVTRYGKRTQNCKIDAKDKTWIKIIRNVKYPQKFKKYAPPKSSC